MHHDLSTMQGLSNKHFAVPKQSKCIDLNFFKKVYMNLSSGGGCQFLFFVFPGSQILKTSIYKNKKQKNKKTKKKQNIQSLLI